MWLGWKLFFTLLNNDLPHCVHSNIAAGFLWWQEALHWITTLAKSITSVRWRLMLFLPNLSVTSFWFKTATFLSTTLWRFQGAGCLTCHICLLNLLFELVAYFSEKVICASCTAPWLLLLDNTCATTLYCRYLLLQLWLPTMWVLELV